MTAKTKRRQGRRGSSEESKYSGSGQQQQLPDPDDIITRLFIIGEGGKQYLQDQITTSPSRIGQTILSFLEFNEEFLGVE